MESRTLRPPKAAEGIQSKDHDEHHGPLHSGQEVRDRCVGLGRAGLLGLHGAADHPEDVGDAAGRPHQLNVGVHAGEERNTDLLRRIGGGADKACSPRKGRGIPNPDRLLQPR